MDSTDSDPVCCSFTLQETQLGRNKFMLRLISGQQDTVIQKPTEFGGTFNSSVSQPDPSINSPSAATHPQPLSTAQGPSPPPEPLERAPPTLEFFLLMSCRQAEGFFSQCFCFFSDNRAIPTLQIVPE